VTKYQHSPPKAFLRGAAKARDRHRHGLQAELLLLDEPAAGMNPEEKLRLMGMIGKSGIRGSPSSWWITT